MLNFIVTDSLLIRRWSFIAGSRVWLCWWLHKAFLLSRKLRIRCTVHSSISPFLSALSTLWLIPWLSLNVVICYVPTFTTLSILFQLNVGRIWCDCYDVPGVEKAWYEAETWLDS